MFVIAMEALGKMISATVSRGLLFGFFMGNGNVGEFDISYLLFAYDTLIFCGVDPDHLHHHSYLIPNSIKGRNLDIKPHQCIPEWTDGSQHVFHRL